MTATAQRQYGIFRADGRLTGTWDSAERAELFLDRYGEGAYVRYRVVVYSPWIDPDAPDGSVVPPLDGAP